MTSYTFLKLSFALLISCMVFAGWMSYSNPELSPLIYMPLLHLFSVPFMVAGIVELNASNRIDRKEKIMWTFGFIALTFITGILYFISERKRVVSL